MSRVPGFMLRHRITVEPYLGVWGAYGAPATGVPCQIQETINSATSQVGVTRYVTQRIICQTDVIAPVGSRLTLPDGRTGYVSATAAHTAPGWPVPEHQELATEVAAGTAPPGGGAVAVTILRRIRAGADRYRNPRYTTSSTTVMAAVRPLSSTERGPAAMGAGRTQIIDAIEVIVPPGTKVGANDRLQARGLTYEVDGTPEDLTDAVTGAQPGIRVIGRRVTG